MPQMVTSMILNLCNIASSYIGPRIKTKLALCLVLCPCASQFKSSKPWYFVSRYPSMISVCKMKWSFLGMGMVRDPMMGQELSYNVSYDLNN
jgi:hypothetical protein